MKTLDQLIMSQSYADTKHLLRREVYRFCKRYGGDPEELFSECALRWVEAFNTYDPLDGEFSTWLVNKVRWHLTEYSRTRRTFVRTRPAPEPLEGEPHGKPCNFSLHEFTDGLSRSAKKVVELALDTPDGVLALLSTRERVGPREVRWALKRYLRKHKGWTIRRVTRTFHEIGRTLP